VTGSRFTWSSSSTASKVGIASVASAVADHWLDLDLTKPGRGMARALTADADAISGTDGSRGCAPALEPHDWLQSLRVAWVADPGGNPIELVQRRVGDSTFG
jgi:hypothetical protein